MRMTLLLLFVTCTVAFTGSQPELWLWPFYDERHEWWQPVTYAFVHAGPVHLALNMLMLVSFGPSLERAWGRWRFLAVYLLCAAVAGTLQVGLADRPLMGASAALFGLFAAWTMSNPRRRVCSVLLLPMPAWAVLVSYLGATIVAWSMGWLDGVAHAAHLAGAVMGVACVGYFKR